MDKILIIRYDMKSTRHYHITNIFDYFVSNQSIKYDYIDMDILISNSNTIFNLKQYFYSTYNYLPKYIIAFGGVGSFNTIIDVLSQVTKLVLIIDDIHHSKSIQAARIQVIKKAEIVFCSYSYQFTMWGLPKPSNLYFFPHSARWICEYNSNPIDKILISGRISNIYPDREFAYNKASKYHSIFDILICNINYRENNIETNDGIYGKKFYDYLNKYLCCFVDTARNYILAKIFEICASGSLLLCMDTDLNVKCVMNELGFKDNHNYISCTRENFMDKARWIVNKTNKTKVNTIRQNGHELIKTNHMWENRMNFLCEKIE